MIASLYHNGSAASAPSRSAAGAAGICNESVMTGASLAKTLHPQYMRRLTVWIQRDVMIRTLPSVARACQQIMRLEGLIRRYSELFGRQMQPAGLRMKGIEIYRHQDDVVQVFCCFAIREQLVVVSRVKLKPPI